MSEAPAAPLGPSVLRKLWSLGATSSEVADQLAARGFKGTRGSSEDDPLAHYLVDAFGARSPGIRFYVSDVSATLSDGGPWCTHLPVPPQVGQFVRELDMGMYLELEREPGTVAGYDELVDANAHAPRPRLCVVAE